SSAYSGYRGNYKVTRVASRTSMASALYVKSQYRVSLDLSAKEISLLRYMWNQMLGEELAEEKSGRPSSALPIPGSLWAQAKEKPASSTPRHALGASSMFCSQLYLNLLTMDPGLEVEFPLLRHQAVSMAGVLSLAVNSFENLAQLDDYLVELGNRHSRILGIEPAQFELMGEAFIQTFHERFGTRFTHELEVLWIKFYMYLANSLLQFGLDPVMRPDYMHNGPYAVADLAAELIFTAESDDIMTMNNSMQREYTATDMSSMGSMPKASSFARHGSVGGTSPMDKTGVSLVLAQASQPARTKKK
ncbi:globin-like protein, partial [Metschnikowia bicuspidata var. bicuspidata NRRL YB-4993]